MIKKFTSS